jgi:hypothetical protein
MLLAGAIAFIAMSALRVTGASAGERCNALPNGSAKIGTTEPKYRASKVTDAGTTARP